VRSCFQVYTITKWRFIKIIKLQAHNLCSCEECHSCIKASFLFGSIVRSFILPPIFTTKLELPVTQCNINTICIIQTFEGPCFVIHELYIINACTWMMILVMEIFTNTKPRCLLQWCTKGGGFGGSNPLLKFLRFDKAEPNSQFHGKYICNNLIRIWVSLICKLSATAPRSPFFLPLYAVLQLYSVIEVSVHLMITVQKKCKNISNSFTYQNNKVRIRDNTWH
jgi:hypothetical protein